MSPSSSLCGLPMTPSPDLFEFSSGGGSAVVEMCAADDIIREGKLLPYKVPPPPPLKIPQFDHRRWESLDGRDHRRRAGGGGLTVEYRKLRRAVSDSVPLAPPASPVKLRPRWYLFAFGSVKVPAEMEMRDIKSRLRRQNSPAVETAETNGCGCDGGKRPAWKILRSLSCKGAESAVAVTAPLNFVSHVREVSSGPF